MDEEKSKYDEQWDEHKHIQESNESYQAGVKNTGGGSGCSTLALGIFSSIILFGLVFYYI